MGIPGTFQVTSRNTNPRFFYNYAKRFAKTKSSVSPIRDNSGTLKTDPIDKAELLQAQYVKVFSDPNSANVDACLAGLNPVPDRNLDNITFTVDDIVEAIKELDPYSSTPDRDIPAKVLTKCKDSLAVPIFLLWHDSFRSGVIPPSMKTQYITPVYEKGDRTSAANYRPVSITSHLIKILESAEKTHRPTHGITQLFVSAPTWFP